MQLVNRGEIDALFAQGNEELEKFRAASEASHSLPEIPSDLAPMAMHVLGLLLGVLHGISAGIQATLGVKPAGDSAPFPIVDQKRDKAGKRIQSNLRAEFDLKCRDAFGISRQSHPELHNLLREHQPFEVGPGPYNALMDQLHQAHKRGDVIQLVRSTEQIKLLPESADSREKLKREDPEKYSSCFCYSAPRFDFPTELHTNGAVWDLELLRNHISMLLARLESEVP